MKEKSLPSWSEQGFAFDMSISTLMRINYNLYIANTLSGAENVEGLKDWFDSVRVVDREIHPLLNENEIETVKELRFDVNRTLNINNRNINKGILYDKVDSYEREIRRLIHKYKLYMKKGEDAGTAIFR